MKDIKNRSCQNCAHCEYISKAKAIACVDAASKEVAFFIDNPVPGEVCINYKRRMNIFQTMDNEKLAEIYKEMLLAERDGSTSPQIKSIAMIVNNERYNGDLSLYIVIDMVKEQFYKEVCRRYLHPEYKK